MKELLLGLLLTYTISNDSITGNVLDDSSKEKLTGVMVVLNEKDTTYTDFNGYFKFKNIDTLKSIDLTYISYSNRNIKILSTDSLLTNK